MPLAVAIACLLLLEGGPIIYRSRRLGREGKVFHLLKFRTMKPDADKILRELLARKPELRVEWEASYKLASDPRTTKIGRFLRVTSMDELPQFINVLCGEMSLVGPRPLLLEEVPHHQQSIDLYMSVLPGITGLWQVSGRNDLEYDQRRFLNDQYVQNWSIWSDFVILLKTVPAVLSRRGAS
jgi:undecaprenyl-phosphate galactose phosphotransferase